MRTRIALLVSFLLALTSPASSIIGVIDDVPAATLLLPYFEVDLDNPKGVTTLFSINNAADTAVLAHVVIWSDLSVHVLDFNVYLTGYDVQTINLRDILIHGQPPQTASAGQDPTDTISPQGSLSQDINFASCASQLPLTELQPIYLQHLRLSLTGKGSPLFGNLCAGRDLGDNIARGYVTIDVVNNCTLRFPGDIGYFAPGGTGDAANENVLWGDFFIIHDAENSAFGNLLVHIEASANDPQAYPQTSVPGQYTFYGRYVGWTAADNREPLASQFGGRYLNGGDFDGGTEYLVWRDSKVDQAPFPCPAVAGVNPAWFPLSQQGIDIFDEQENSVTLPTSPVSPPIEGFAPFPAEAQRTVIGSPDFPVPFMFGWLRLNLNTSVAAAGANPPEDPTAAQAWVIDPMRARGRFSVGFGANQQQSAAGSPPR